MNWSALEAIGTLGAVFVALVLAAGPAWRRRWTKPKLTLIVSSVEPHCVAIGSTKTLVACVVLRAEVRNDGKRSAEHVAAKMTAHWIEDLPVDEANYPPGLRPFRIEGWRLHESEPTSLKWASGRSVTIAPGQSEFVCLVSLRPNDRELTLCMLDPEESILTGRLGSDRARHRLGVVVTADDCKPIVGVVEFVVDGKQFISKVAISEVPAGARDTRLLTLLREMAESPNETAASASEVDALSPQQATVRSPDALEGTRPDVPAVPVERRVPDAGSSPVEIGHHDPDRSPGSGPTTSGADQ